MSLFGIGRRYHRPFYRTDRSYIRNVYSRTLKMSSRNAGNVVRREKRLRKGFSK